MLRIHARRLARSDAEKGGIERVSVLHESAPARDHPARRGGVRVMETRRVPSLHRHLADGVHAAAEEVPKRARIIGSAGKAAGHPDDRDRLSLSHALSGTLRKK